jgi:hypothetical protein
MASNVSATAQMRAPRGIWSPFSLRGYVHPQEDAVMNMFSELGGHNIGHSENLELSEGESESDVIETNQES